MKRALFVTVTDRAGGAERVAAMLARGLSQDARWSVDVYVLCGRCEPSFTQSVLADSTVRVIYGPFGRERRAVFPFIMFLLRAKYDLVFSTHVHSNAIVSAITRFRPLTAVRLVTRESTVLFDRYFGWRRRFFQLCYWLYGAQVIIVAQTSYMAEHIRRHLPKRLGHLVRVIPNPLDLEAVLFRSAEPLEGADLNLLSGRENIIFCGRQIQVKRPDLALYALHEMKRQLFKATPRLVFVGDGPMRPQLDILVRELDLSDDVVFLGQRDNPYQIMAACQYGLLTSEREGFPNVVLEMMACGVRKIVVTPCTGDLDRLTGVAVASGMTPEAIAKPLVQAITDTEDHSTVYLEHVAARSVESFLEAIL